VKYELTKEDKEKIERVEKYDAVIKFLKNQENIRFKVGDTFIRMVPTYEDGKTTWKPEEVSEVTKTPKKYLYAHENDVGVGFVKIITASGKPGQGMTPMTEFNFQYCRFELDPDMADHVLLADEGEEFDAVAAYKRKKKFREKASKLNKKQMVPMDSIVDRTKFLETLKVGDQFWCGNYMDRMVKQKVEVIAINDKLTVNELTYDRDAWKEYQKEYPELAGITLKQYTFKTLTSDTSSRVGTIFKEVQRSMDRYVTWKPPYSLSEE
jgi:hypothetical protein